MRFVGAMRSHVGHIRDSNEDCAAWVACVASGAGGALLIVADGMGGHAAGEVASQLAVETVLAEYSASEAPAGQALARALEAANQRIYRDAQSNPSRRGMGTTCTAAVLLEAGVVVAHVGDSRLYRIRGGGEIERLTEDDSLVAELVRAGRVAPEAARSHPSRNVLLRSLGTEEEITVGGFREPLPVSEDDCFLVSSDGLHDLVSDDEIADAVCGQDLEIACALLIDLALVRGGHDNITVALARAEPGE